MKELLAGKGQHIEEGQPWRTLHFEGHIDGRFAGYIALARS
jgi:hypothetical protein